MKEESKYYTPTLEEFHVGFELEIKLHELKPWEKHVWLPGDQASSVEKYLDQVRVKYLDKEDIESLGFILKREFNCFIKIDIYSVDCFLYFNPWYTQIKVGGDITKTKQVFEGRIKNKSELQQILKMVL